MKKTYTVFAVVLFLFFSYLISSCNMSKIHTKKGWDVISKQLFGKTNTKEEVKDIVAEALGHFDKAIFWDQLSWAGYAGKAQTFRFTYFLHPDILPLKEFLQRVLEVYELWFSNNNEDKKHLIPYAVTLYIDGQKEKALRIFSKYYNENYVYNLHEPKNNDVFNLIAGMFLEEIKKDDFKNTVYENLLILTEEGLISSFVGG